MYGSLAGPSGTPLPTTQHIGLLYAKQLFKTKQILHEEQDIRMPSKTVVERRAERPQGEGGSKRAFLHDYVRAIDLSTMRTTVGKDNGSWTIGTLYAGPSS